ncbi:MAG TPA: aminotransferase class I/II-fold pyridoxal phosphate-dependent enzyme [Thermoplasmata archaeon]|nr:aminotransferase class I/II-fold pyridoxal phosphate-dependent enzyme [Thermoplasmata archaeon]
MPEWAGLGTVLVHGARRPERNAAAVVPPIYQTSTFHYPSDFSEAREGGDVHLYTRLDNPTHEVAAELVRAAEGGEAARVFSSGMGAISSTVLAFVRPGDTVVALDELYGGTLDLLRDTLSGLGVGTRWVTAEEARAPEDVVQGAPKLVYVESPTNPCLAVHDLRRWAEAAHDAGALLVVDNTFATPVNQNPIALGADLVVHSATKYLGGHADLIAGAVVGTESLVDRVGEVSDNLGPTLDPFAAFLLTRGLRTLALRVGRQNENGRSVVAAVAKHPEVDRVDYPGRRSPEDERLAAEQMRGRGGMVSITVRGGRAAAERFLHRLKLVHVASSLGGVESLASVPSITSHRHLSNAELERRGIREGLVRISLGVEEPSDLVRDVTEALDGLGSESGRA